MNYAPYYIEQELQTPLPEELDSLVEQLAEKVHDRWAVERLKQGWIHGAERSDQLKTSPTLIPYDALPEGEKAVDRATVETVLKLLISSGFHISKQ